jgi:hypothetical protein
LFVFDFEKGAAAFDQDEVGGGGTEMATTLPNMLLHKSNLP